MDTMRTTGVPGGQGSGLLWSARMIALAGIGLIGYAILFLVVNFTNFIELALGQNETSATKDTVMTFSPKFDDYVSHLVGHLGLIDLDLLIFAVGFVLGLRGVMGRSTGAGGST